MILERGNPATLAACGASGIADLAAGKIDPEDNQTALRLQAHKLASAFALPIATARTVARLHFGEVA